MDEPITYEVSLDPSGFSVRFNSTLVNINRAVCDIKKYLKENHEIKNSLYFAIHLLLLEGLTNAVKHGNRYDPKKTVDFSMTVSKNRMTLLIKDMGGGFKWQGFHRRGLPSTSDHGRGLHIINRYATSFSYNEKGNILTVILNLHEDPGPA